MLVEGFTAQHALQGVALLGNLQVAVAIGAFEVVVQLDVEGVEARVLEQVWLSSMLAWLAS